MKFAGLWGLAAIAALTLSWVAVSQVRDRVIQPVTVIPTMLDRHRAGDPGSDDRGDRACRRRSVGPRSHNLDHVGLRACDLVDLDHHPPAIGEFRHITDDRRPSDDLDDRAARDHDPYGAATDDDVDDLIDEPGDLEPLNSRRFGHDQRGAR